MCHNSISIYNTVISVNSVNKTVKKMKIGGIMNRESEKITTYTFILSYEVAELLKKFNLWNLMRQKEVKKLSNQLAPAVVSELRKSLLTEIILSLSRVFEKNSQTNDFNINLRSYLTLLESNISNLELAPNSKTITSEMIENHLQSINNMENTINSLYRIRSKIVAHLDSRYINNIRSQRSDADLIKEEIVELVALSYEIMDFYLSAIKGERIPIDTKINSEMQFILKNIKR